MPRFLLRCLYGLRAPVQDPLIKPEQHSVRHEMPRYGEFYLPWGVLLWHRPWRQHSKFQPIRAQYLGRSGPMRVLHSAWRLLQDTPQSTMFSVSMSTAESMLATRFVLKTSWPVSSQGSELTNSHLYLLDIHSFEQLGVPDILAINNYR